MLQPPSVCCIICIFGSLIVSVQTGQSPNQVALPNAPLLKHVGVGIGIGIGINVGGTAGTELGEEQGRDTRQMAGSGKQAEQQPQDVTQGFPMTAGLRLLSPTYSTETVGSVDRCISQCQNVGECVAISFDSSRQFGADCFLFKTPIKEYQQDAVWYSWIKPTDSGAFLQQGLRLIGTRNIPRNVGSVQACIVWCERMPDCIGISYDPTKQNKADCFAFNGAPENFIYDAVCLSWLKPTPFRAHPGLRLLGRTYLTESVGGVPQCIAKCEQDIDCLGMTFDSTKQFGVDCFTFHGTVDQYAFDPVWSTWFKPFKPGASVQQGLRLLGSQYVTRSMGSVRLCIEWCQRMPNCIAITFDPMKQFGVDCFAYNGPVVGYLFDAMWSSWLKPK